MKGKVGTYTPGPWQVSGHSGLWAIEAAPHGMLAAIRFIGSERVAEEEANARLMASAPALRAALTDAKEALSAILDEPKTNDEGKQDLDTYAETVRTLARAALKGVGR